jgi:hypothetical protein
MRALTKQGIAAALLSLAAAGSQAAPVSADDAFTGASVTGFKGSLGPGGSFDGSLSDPFNVTFVSSGAADSLGFLDFETGSAVSLSGIRLFAASDGEAIGNRRSMSTFRLYADTNGDVSMKLHWSTLA